MKTPNQAEVKTSKRSLLTPSQKRLPHEPVPSTLRGGVSFAILPDDPFRQGNMFELTLDWIGDMMEPEIFQGNLAMVVKREDMSPCSGELVVGILKTGHMVFGAHEYEAPGVCRIAFINPDYAPVYYPEKHFQWLYPVASISMLTESQPRYRKVMKTVQFFYGGE